MRITCPSCDTSYTIPDDKIGAKGRQVKCASCGTKWQVSLADAVGAEPPVDVDDLFENDTAQMADPGSFSPPSPALPPVAAAQVAADVDDMFDEPQTESEVAVAPARSAVTRGVDAVAGAEDDAWETTAAEAAEIAAAEARKNDIESLAKKPKIQAKKGKVTKPKIKQKFDFERFLVRARPVLGAATLVMAIGVMGGALALRTPITAAFPSLASFYSLIGLPVNLRGLDIGHLQIMREVENGQPVLVVEGELSNSSSGEHSVPAIRFALRGDDSQEIYAWSIEPKQALLTPGATMRFRTRLASPPEQAADIQVRMIDRRNQQASLHE